MVNPYLLMAVLYLAVGALTAMDASLTSLDLLAWIPGLRWLRVHFITLGVLTEIIFGVTPALVAHSQDRPRPSTRWDIWLTLNGGIIVLLVGIPIINQAMILVGGSLVFIATTLLAWQLWKMRRDDSVRQPGRGSLGFYISGFLFLLLGITIGTGLWLGWSAPLRIQVPLEAHIHANNWGFMSLVFAGLLIHVLPSLTGHNLAPAHTIGMIFWGMSVGALFLVIGPWLGGNLWFTVPGLIMHLAATLALLVQAIRRLSQGGLLAQAGSWHLITSYLWILAPVMAAPLIILGVPGFPGPVIESTAPQALIYGWVLQFGMALVPYVARRIVLKDDEARLGGSWLSFTTANLGSALIWAGIFLTGLTSLLHGLAYALFAMAMLAVFWELIGVLRQARPGLEAFEGVFEHRG